MLCPQVSRLHFGLFMTTYNIVCDHGVHEEKHTRTHTAVFGMFSELLHDFAARAAQLYNRAETLDESG